MLLRRSQPTIRKLSTPTRPSLPGPVSPLERNPQSPKGWKNRESDGVGLGIVAALEKSDSRKISETIKYVTGPISIGGNSPRGAAAQSRCNWRSRCCDGTKTEKFDDRGLFSVSSPPPRVADNLQRFRMADFLNYCHLCRKKLHGKDIYMYRGEKGFCSMECRYQQIVSDEFHEKCGSEALRSTEVSRSSYTDDRLFFTSIAVA